MENIFIKPVISEKSLKQIKDGFYTFLVQKDADKKLIKRVVEDQFGVNVLKVLTIKVTGKKRRVGRRMLVVQRQPLKKAIVKIKKEQKIPLFEVGV